MAKIKVGDKFKVKKDIIYIPGESVTGTTGWVELKDNEPQIFKKGDEFIVTRVEDDDEYYIAPVKNIEDEWCLTDGYDQNPLVDWLKKVK
jgi:hypothetical protein